jgi:hypothetical protein
MKISHSLANRAVNDLNTAVQISEIWTAVHTYPHINFYTQSGAKATIQIQPFEF